MNLSSRQIILIGGGVLFLIIIVLIFSFGSKPPPPPKVTLTIWGMEPKSNFSPLIDAYKAARPNVTINYVEFDENNYRQKVLDALASASGPDIFMIKSKSLLRDLYKLYPAPQTQINLVTLRSLFPQVVEDDFVYQNNIYALPLYIDSLALFYNQDYFNSKQIIGPPANWDEFVGVSSRLKVLDSSFNIISAGAAFGFSERNVFYAPHILKLLMKQLNIPVFDKSGYANFSARDEKGAEVLSFYTSFTNPKTSNYVWPRDFENSIDAFARGKVAMIFAYHKDISKILNKNPYLNFKIAQAPQVKDSQVNYSYADYWALAVSRQSQNPTWAWDFIIYVTSNPQVAENYINTTQKPPALKSLIAKYINDPNLGVFAGQALSARSWPELDMEKTNEILNDIIEGVVFGKFSSSQGIKLAEEQINQILRGLIIYQ